MDKWIPSKEKKLLSNRMEIWGENCKTSSLYGCCVVKWNLTWPMGCSLMGCSLMGCWVAQLLYACPQQGTCRGFESRPGMHTDKKKKISSYIRKSKRERLQSHIWLTASSYIPVFKYLRISSYIRKPLLIYDFATVPNWISLYLKKILFYFLSVHGDLFAETTRWRLKNSSFV